MDNPGGAFVTIQLYMTYAFFLGVFPALWTKITCYDKKGNLKFKNKQMVIVVYCINFLIWGLACSFITSVSKDITLENITAGDKLWYYITMLDSDDTFITTGGCGDEKTTTYACYTRKNADEIGENELRFMAWKTMLIMYQVEDFEIKGSEGGWYITADDEYIASIFVKGGLFLTEVKFVWDRKKIEEYRFIWEESRLVTYIVM